MLEKNKLVILVNPLDQEIGQEKKLLAHQYGMLHRAFSVLVFRNIQGKTELLLQQRSKKKYHTGGLWTNTCCSHPQPNEPSLLKAAEERLKEEMGITIPLKEKGLFHYIASLDNDLYENELDHVLVGNYDPSEKIRVNPGEVEDYHWAEIKELQQDLELYPKKYTPWLKMALKIALET